MSEIKDYQLTEWLKNSDEWLEKTKDEVNKDYPGSAYIATNKITTEIDGKTLEVEVKAVFVTYEYFGKCREQVKEKCNLSGKV